MLFFVFFTDFSCRNLNSKSNGYLVFQTADHKHSVLQWPETKPCISSINVFFLIISKVYLSLWKSHHILFDQNCHPLRNTPHRPAEENRHYWKLNTDTESIYSPWPYQLCQLAELDNLFSTAGIRKQKNSIKAGLVLSFRK